jgi:hypothetical protein
MRIGESQRRFDHRQFSVPFQVLCKREFYRYAMEREDKAKGILSSQRIPGGVFKKQPKARRKESYLFYNILFEAGAGFVRFLYEKKH